MFTLYIWLKPEIIYGQDIQTLITRPRIWRVFNLTQAEF